MLVQDIMSHALRTATPETPLLDVVSVMCLYRFSGLPVVDDSGNLTGFIAEKDVLHRMFPSLEELMEQHGSVDYDQMMGRYRDVVDLKVKDLMSSGVVSVTPDMHILRAATIIVRHKFRRIPVTENGKLVGMVSLGDIHKAIFQANLSKGLCAK